MKTSDEIKEEIRKHNDRLVQKYGLRVVGMFGSSARGVRKRGSDIDLLAELERPVSLLELLGAELYLSRILKAKVDLVPRDDIREELRDSILQDAVYL